jgi:hypothetical protein
MVLIVANTLQFREERSTAMSFWQLNPHGTLAGHYGVIDRHWWPQLTVDEIAFPRYPECCHLLKGVESCELATHS